jgi:hypothetical protein
VCAGAGQELEDWGRGSEPELRVPDAALYEPPPGPFTPQPGPPGPGPFTPFPAPPTSFEPPTQRRDGPPTGWAEPPRRPMDSRGLARPSDPGRPPLPTTGRHGEGEGGDLSGLGELDARRPPTIPCERCQAPLAARDFFVCKMCRGRMCSRHRSAQQGEMCDLCASGPLGAPPQELLSTAGDEASGRAWKKSDYARETTADTGVRRDLAETLAGEGPAPPPPPPPPPPPARDVMDLSGVQFECPYCDAPITQTTRTCPKCQRQL